MPVPSLSTPRRQLIGSNELDDGLIRGVLAGGRTARKGPSYPGAPAVVVRFDAVDDMVVATDPSGQRWGVVVAPPGTLDDVVGHSVAESVLTSGLFAASRGWRVVVYRIDEQDRWKGPVGRQKVKDQAAAGTVSVSIVEAIESGRFGASFRG